MAELNAGARKLVVKIVYYGPALSGKTTNLMNLHEYLNPDRRGELMSFETKGDRTLFFDLLPLMAASDAGFRVKVKLFTVPGQVAHDATRKAVLSRADGVVFVADSQRHQAVSNAESFSNLEANAGRVGLDFETLPLVIQFNKRDLTDIMPADDIRSRWRATGLPVQMASALQGKGVLETFRLILKATYGHIDRQLDLRRTFDLREEDVLRLAAPTSAAEERR